MHYTGSKDILKRTMTFTEQGSMRILYVVVEENLANARLATH